MAIKEQYIHVDQIVFDTENPRLPEPRPESQDALWTAMLEMESGQGAQLANDLVASGGIFPAEKIVVVPNPKHADTYIVLEGNRRVAASKALLHHSKLPSALAKQIPALNDAQLKSLRIGEIGAVIVDEREDAEQYIARRHQGHGGIAWWKPHEQRQYIGNKFFEDKLTPKQIAVVTGIPEGILVGDIRRATFLRVALNKELMGWTTEELNAFRKSKGITNLERVIEMASGRKFLGITFAAEKILTHVKPEKFLIALRQITRDALLNKMEAGRSNILNSRMMNNDKDLEKFISENYQWLDTPKAAPLELAEILKKKPVKLPPEEISKKSAASKGGTTTAGGKPYSERNSSEESQESGKIGSLNAGGGSSEGGIPSGKGHKPQPFMADVVCHVKDDRLAQICTEIKAVSWNLKAAPISAHMLLRALLEQALKYYLNNRLGTGGKTLFENFINSQKTGKSGEILDPSLRELIRWCVANKVFSPEKADFHDVLNTYVHSGMFRVLNIVAHKDDEFPTPSTANDHANKLRSVLQYILSGKWLNGTTT